MQQILNVTKQNYKGHFLKLVKLTEQILKLNIKIRWDT